MDGKPDWLAELRVKQKAYVKRQHTYQDAYANTTEHLPRSRSGA